VCSLLPAGINLLNVSLCRDPTSSWGVCKDNGICLALKARRSDPVRSVLFESYFLVS
jgi:hypothetical protein